MHDDVKELCKHCDKCQHTNNVVGLPRKEKDRDEKTKGDKEKKTEKHRDVGGA